MPAPAWAPPGSLLPGRLSPTPPVPEAIPGSVMNFGISCPQCGWSLLPRLAGGNLLASLGYGALGVCAANSGLPGVARGLGLTPAAASSRLSQAGLVTALPGDSRHRSVPGWTVWTSAICPLTLGLSPCGVLMCADTRGLCILRPAGRLLPVRVRMSGVNRWLPPPGLWAFG